MVVENVLVLRSKRSKVVQMTAADILYFFMWSETYTHNTLDVFE